MGAKARRSHIRKYKEIISIWLLIGMLCILAHFTLRFNEKGISGLVVYKINEQTKQFDFVNPEEYFYNGSLINLSGGVRLIPVIEITSIANYSYNEYYITKALYNPDDKTNRVNALDNKRFEAEDKIFDFIFGEKLNNDDMIHLYLNHGEAGEIFLCDLGDNCNALRYGVVDYNGDEGWYNITISGLSGAVAGFNINRRAKTNFNYVYAEHNNEEISVIRALYSPHDGTDKVNTLDNEKISVGENANLNVIFEDNAHNGDIISIYAKLNGNTNEIFLCDYGIECTSPGYGKVDINEDNEEGGNEEENEYLWFNITVSGLVSPTDKININSKFSIDYIFAYRFINNSYNLENIKYPLSATIDTQDLVFQDFASWVSLITNESLYGQIIDYYYSTDSGLSWVLINNLDLANVNSSKIRLRAELVSDWVDTPVLNYLAIKYRTKEICEENWIINYSECGINNTKTKYYTDENNCGTQDNIPKDNWTYAECDYCTPIWSCLGYDDCKPDNRRYCNAIIDSNHCYNITGLIADSYTGNYSEFTVLCYYDYSPPKISNLLIAPNKGPVGIIVNISLNAGDKGNISTIKAIISDSKESIVKRLVMYWSNGSYVGAWDTANLTEGTYLVGINVSDINNNSGYYKQQALVALASSAKGSFTRNIAPLIENQASVINASETTDTLIEVVSKSNLNMSISIAKYSGSLKDTVSSKIALGNIEIIVDNTTNENIAKAKISIYYNESEVDSLNIEEGTLKIYYYNETSKGWQPLNSSLNISANYVWAELPHFSIYGIFGDQKQSGVPSSDSISYSSGYSGSGYSSYGVEGYSKGVNVSIATETQEAKEKKVIELTSEEVTNNTIIEKKSIPINKGVISPNQQDTSNQDTLSSQDRTHQLLALTLVVILAIFIKYLKGVRRLN